MTNKQRWELFTRDIPSPQQYLDWSWLFMISACLQRRVWLGPSHMQCFPNMYVILVGEPGVGKGNAISPVEQCLRHWKKDDVLAQVHITATDEQKKAAKIIGELDASEAQKNEAQGSTKSGGQDTYKPLLYPIAADAITYEALVESVAQSYRRINYYEFSEEHRKDIPKIYGSCSLCFVLKELSSLLRKRTHDTMSYLLGIYDCPVDYEYKTKTQGKERIRRACLNMLAGTQPAFMSSTFDEGLIGEGFTSRTFFIYASRNRKSDFFIPDLDQEQKSAQKDILEHIKKLSCLYGQVKLDTETVVYLNEWWKEWEAGTQKRTNKSLKMVPYYARKKVHIMKIAMALHFSESTEMFIPLTTFKLAMKILEETEKSMHLAIVLQDTNKEAKVAKEFIKYLESGEKSKVDVLCELYTLASQDELIKAIDFLLETDKISLKTREDEATGKNMIWYKLRN